MSRNAKISHIIVHLICLLISQVSIVLAAPNSSRSVPLFEPILQSKIIVVGTPNRIKWSSDGNTALLQIMEPRVLFSDLSKPERLMMTEPLIMISPRRYIFGSPIVSIGKSQLLFLKTLIPNVEENQQFGLTATSKIYGICDGENSSILADFKGNDSITSSLKDNYKINDLSQLIESIAALSAWKIQETTEARTKPLLLLFSVHKRDKIYSENIPPLINSLLIYENLKIGEEDNFIGIAKEINKPGNWFNSSFKRRLVNAVIRLLNQNSKDPLFTDYFPAMLTEMGVGYVQNDGVYRWDGAEMKKPDKPNTQWIGPVPD